MSAKELIEMIEAAQNNFAGADWTHESRDLEGNIVLDEHENPVICEDGNEDTCDTCRKAQASAEIASEYGDAAIAAIIEGDKEAAIEQLRLAASEESEWGDDPVWRPVVKAAESLDLVHCECGEVTGERCAWSGPIAETVIVEYMPEYLRASHEAAGNAGQYPANGAIRMRVEKRCAGLIVSTEGEWAEVKS